MTSPREVTGGVPRYRWAIAVAVVSAVTMQVTAMWFLLAGWVALVATALSMVLRPRRRIPPIALAGIGLLAGPAIYLSFALVA